MADDFLKKILLRKREIIEQRRGYFENLRTNLSKSTYNRYSIFKRSISVPGRVNLIAEIKKASPSRGLIRDDFDPMFIAKAYEDAGAAAFSVLTEEDFFLGRPAYLKRITEEFHLPALMKDFVIDDLQLFEARFCGASAVLLIVAALEDVQLKALLDLAHSLDLDCLVEVHDATELERALCAGAEIIGVNNRNLRTFDVSLSVAEDLISRIPRDKVIVGESGIKTHDDVKRLAAAGAHAVLIGETFMREKDIARKVKDVMHGTG